MEYTCESILFVIIFEIYENLKKASIWFVHLPLWDFSEATGLWHFWYLLASFLIFISYIAFGVLIPFFPLSINCNDFDQYIFSVFEDLIIEKGFFYVPNGDCSKTSLDDGCSAKGMFTFHLWV